MQRTTENTTKCVEGRVLLEEEEQEKKAEKEVEQIENDAQEERAEEEVKEMEVMVRICYLLRRITQHTASTYQLNERCLNKYPSTLLKTRPLKGYPRTTVSPP